jgi:hypothetical protein
MTAWASGRDSGIVLGAAAVYFARQAVGDYQIEGAGPRRVFIRHRVTRAPQILALQLSRYAADPETFDIRKLRKVVEVEEFMQLPVADDHDVLYSLHGVFMHSGGERRQPFCVRAANQRDN